MSYKLIRKTSKELRITMSEGVEDLSQLLKYELQEDERLLYQEAINELQEKIDELDDFDEENWYLIDDNEKEFFNFKNRFDGFNTLQEIEFRGEKYIEVRFANSNNQECIALVDYSGNIIIDQFIDYHQNEIVGKYLQVLREGYMIQSSEYLKENELYYSIFTLNGTEFDLHSPEGIIIFEEFDLFLTRNKLFNGGGEFICNVYDDDDAKTLQEYGYFKISSDDKGTKLGLAFKGDVIITPQFKNIRLIPDLEIEDILIFKITGYHGNGLIVCYNGKVILETKLKYQDIDCLFANKYFLLATTKIEGARRQILKLNRVGEEVNEDFYTFGSFINVSLRNYLNFFAIHDEFEKETILFCMNEYDHHPILLKMNGEYFKENIISLISSNIELK